MMIAVYIEIRDGKVKKSSLEALSEAKRNAEELGVETAAVMAGQGMENLAGELFPYGAGKVFILENANLSAYNSQGYAAVLCDWAREAGPKALFFAATSMGKDLAPRVAARLGVGMASDCIQVDVKDGNLAFTRPVYAGKALLSVSLSSTPQIATLRPNVFPLVEPAEGQGEVIKKDVDVPGDSIKGRVAEIMQEESAALDVTEAETVISGGRGMKAPENFDLLRELTSIIPRSAVGASRSAVDSGWIGHQHQVGQTGKTVSPNLYIAMGVSGAIQHLAGMSSSKYIVAVNKDPDAPIFKVADYGIVGDLFQVIPHLKEELKKALAE
jgi:electron transfer flavoprotein alpha subunit